MDDRRVQGWLDPAAVVTAPAGDAAPAAYFLALLMALACVFYMYTPEFLLGNVAMFLQGDAAQHVSGWMFYRDDAWRFPLLMTERMNAPEGVSIAFTDSIPLVALALKPFRQWLPDHFHYIGLWHAVIYLLQSQAAVYLIRSLGVRSLIASLVAAGFALTWPALLMRFGHTSLLTHALLLFAFALYFRNRTGRLTFYAAGWRYLLLVCVAMMIHPYLLAMCYTIFLAFLLDFLLDFLLGFSGDFPRDFPRDNARQQKPVRDVLTLLAASLLLIASLYYALGYGGNALQTAGFGLYSMNLLSPFCGGQLWHCVTDGTGGQGFEGYNYFGAGFLFLCAVALWRLRGELMQLVRSCPALFLMAAALTIYALSNQIYFSTHRLLAYPLPGLLQKLADTFRCSGRFFWVVGYLLLFVVLSGLARFSRWPMQVVMLGALVLQVYDTNPLRDRVREQVNRPMPAATMEWQALLQDVDNIDVYPIYGCGDDYQDFQLRYQVIAAHYGKIINTGYVARAANLCAAKHKPFDQAFQARHLYVVPADRTGGIQYLPKGFSAAVAKHECVRLESDILCMPGQRADELAARVPALKPVDTVEAVRQWRLAPQFLLTAIGHLENNALVAPSGTAGFLSFGPYRSIGPGRYAVAINLDVSRCADAVIGYWDATAELGTRQLTRAELRVDSGRAVVEGNFVAEAELNKFEIRTFVSGACETRLLGITLTRQD